MSALLVTINGVNRIEVFMMYRMTVIYPEVDRKVIIRSEEGSTMYINIQFDKSERISADQTAFYNNGVLVAEHFICDGAMFDERR